MKSSSTLQDKLVKQNEISRQRLAQELVKLEKEEKSDLRMIETTRHRFRTRHKNLDVSQQSSGSNAINVRMYETHNPGFCYHCTGAIKENAPTIKEQTAKDSYELVRSIVFTKDEVDPDKVLCLHLLTAHSTKWNKNDATTVRPVDSLLEKAKNKHFTGAWNNVIPCYVVDIQEDTNDMKLHENPVKQSLDDQAIRDFEDKYRQYMENNSDFGNVLSSNAKQYRIALHGFEKMPTISPHVYSLLGPSHELRIKQTLAEGVARNKLARSSMELNGLDEYSLSFHLDDDDDLLSRATTNASNRNWVTRSTRSPSRRSTIGSSIKLDHGITMLKSKRKRNADSMPKDLITIKSSFMKEAPSKTSSTKSPFRNIFESRPSMNSLLSATLSPELATRKCRKCIYLNAPIKCIELRNKDYKIVPILVNYQLQALVQTVFEVLERVNPEKSRKIVETARDTEKIRKMLLRSDILNFIQSLLGQSLVSSPESYVVSAATVANEIDFRFEGILEKEIIALTLEMPSVPPLDALIAEIRNNIFLDTKKKTRLNGNAKETASAPNEQKAEKENAAEYTLNPIQVDNKSKTCLTQDKKLSSTNKNKNYLRKRSKKFLKTVRSNKKRDSLKEIEDLKLKQNLGVDYIANKSRESNVMQTSEINYGLNLSKNSRIKAAEQPRVSGSISSKRISNSKAWKAAQDLGHLDADHVILRRMTNPQRILVGQMCASLKTKRINNQGLINESVPLAALITPALSRDSIKFLTRGTVYSKTNAINEQEEKEDNVPDKLTGPLLAKIRQDIAENETKQRLKYFLRDKMV